jgi:3-oxoacyl-[acyl-carrier-protein] synthase-3
MLVPSGTPGIVASHLHADGSLRDMLCVPGQVQNGAVTGSPFLKMDGSVVFKFAVRVLAEVANEALATAGMQADQMDWVIPHQANIRIMDATMKKLQLPRERLIVTVDQHGNTSAASIPLALDIAVRDGRIVAGHHVMLLGVGGGFTWGSVLLRWADD